MITVVRIDFSFSTMTVIRSITMRAYARRTSYFECVRGRCDPKGGELYRSTVNRQETVAEAGRCSDVRIVPPVHSKQRGKANRWGHLVGHPTNHIPDTKTGPRASHTWSSVAATFTSGPTRGLSFRASWVAFSCGKARGPTTRGRSEYRGFPYCQLNPSKNYPSLPDAFDFLL